MYEDKDPWPFKCPKCGEEFTKEIGWLKTRALVKCPGTINRPEPIPCSMSFQMSAEEFGVALTEAKAGRYDPFGHTWVRKQHPR